MTQTVLITGANRGLGLEFARQYAADGWNVIACCRNPAKADTLQTLAKQHSNLRTETLEVDDVNSIKTLAKKLDGTTIDVLINNAGIYSGASKGGVDGNDNSQSFGSIDPEAWLKVLRTNTVAPLMVAQNFVPHVKRSKDAKIINITSKMGALADMGSDYIAYRSSKTALNAAMLAIVNDLHAENIAIANLHPGWVQTDMGGKSAPLVPQDSVSHMRKTIAGVSLKNTGRFLNYDGKVIPW